MKRFLLLALSLLWVSTTIGQLQFKTLIETIDWNSTDLQLAKQFPNDIQKIARYADKHLTTIDYVFHSVLLGDKACEVFIEADSFDRQLKALFVVLNVKYLDSNPKTLRKEMDSSLFKLLGEPDHLENRIDEDVEHYDRIWYTEGQVYTVFQSVYQGEQIYSFTIKKLNPGNDFRNAQWGDTFEKVHRNEQKDNLSALANTYSFTDRVAGIPCTVVFLFSDNKLTTGKYVLKEVHEDKNEYIHEYHDFVALLTKKYGPPDFDNHRWINPLYKESIENYGLAVELGHLIYGAGWLSDLKTKITTRLYREEEHTVLEITYASKKYSKSQLLLDHIKANGLPSIHTLHTKSQKP